MQAEELKVIQLKEQAENQRSKILELKQKEMEKVDEADDAMEFEESVPEAAPKMAAPEGVLRP